MPFVKLVILKHKKKSSSVTNRYVEDLTLDLFIPLLTREQVQNLYPHK